MKSLIFMSALLALSACTQMAPNPTGREPNQYRGDDRRDRYDRQDRRDERRAERRQDRWEERDWRRRGDNRRCVNCFDMRSYNDVVRLGNEVTLLSSAFPSEHTGYVIPTACGIRSVSIEVLDNEAQITGLQVHYAGDSMFNWDTLPVRRDWDLRNAEEGESSMWFDVGSPRQNDRACIDRVKVIGMTYKDMYDYGWAQVQFYGSRTIRGVSDYRPGPSYPAPGPVVIVQPTTWIDEKRVELDPAVSCIQGLPSVPHPDQMHSDSLFGSSKLLGRCSNARENRAVKELQYRGYLCNVDPISPIGRTNTECVDNLTSKITGGKITGTHRYFFNKYCSGEIWVCTKTMTR